MSSAGAQVPHQARAATARAMLTQQPTSGPLRGPQVKAEPPPPDQCPAGSEARRISTGIGCAGHSVSAARDRAVELLPAFARGRGATGLIEACSVVAGVAGVACAVEGARAGTRIAAGCTASIYLAFSAYPGALWRVRGRVPCGCLGCEAPITAWSATRGLGVVVAGVAVAVLPATTLPAPGRLLAVAVAAFGVAMLLSLALLGPAVAGERVSERAGRQPPHRPSGRSATSTAPAGRAR